MKNYVVLLIIVLFSFGCEDIIEKDITNQEVTVLSPPDQFTPNSTSVNFFWNFLEGADAYELEVVRGKFDNVLSFVLDTFVTDNRFTYNFSPGQYEWSLRAVNNEYSTNYIVRSFTIDSVSDISQSSVLLSFPVNNEMYGDSSLTLSWQEIFSATSYLVQLIDKSNNKFILNDTVATNSISTGDTLSTNFYEWKVKAINYQSQTDFTTAEFEIDLTSPGVPQPQTPINQLTPPIDSLVSFTWNPGWDDNWSHDIIYIYESLTNTILQTKNVTDSAFVYSNFVSGKSYYWQVKSFDKVGNESDLSAINNFSIQ